MLTHISGRRSLLDPQPARFFFFFFFGLFIGQNKYIEIFFFQNKINNKGVTGLLLKQSRSITTARTQPFF
jgi:hypothetical protein